MIEIRRANHHTWLGEPRPDPSLGLIRGLVVLACLALWAIGLTVVALMLGSCTVRWEALDGGADPGLSRLTLSLFSDDQSAFSCSTAPDGASTVSLGGQSNPNAESLAILDRVAALLAASDPALARRSRDPPTQAAAAGCAPFPAAPMPARLAATDEPRQLVPNPFGTPQADGPEPGMEAEP